jgi:sialic acid synthase SpsE
LILKIFSEDLNQVYFIAEAGLNHNGDIKIAHQLIDVACEAGADAIKFQKRTVSELATKETLDSQDIRFPFLGSTYREIREKLEFSFLEYEELRDHAKQCNLEFIVTPFDEVALEFLAPLKLKIYKVASHSVRNLDFLSKLAQLHKPIIMSTGMSTLSEIDEAVNIWHRNSNPFALLHCVSSYPTYDQDANIRIILTLKERYGVNIGYSGHELDDFATLVSVSIGAKIVERHITLSRDLPGFDHKLSLDPHELKILIEKIRRIETILGTNEKNLLPSELIARQKYNVSMVSARKMMKGEYLTLNDIVWKNPGTGIPRSNRDDFIGKKLLRDIEADSLFYSEIFE